MQNPSLLLLYNSSFLPSFLPSFMDAGLKFGISRLVRASFASCKSKRLSNDTQDPVFIHHRFRPLQPPSSPLARCTNPSRSPDFEPKSQVKLQEQENPTKTMKRKKKKKQKRNIMPSSSSSGADSRELFSSDGEREEETETLVSSKSFSSDSPELCCRRCRRTAAKSRRRRMHAGNSDVGFVGALDSVPPNAGAVLGGKVRDSVAVVKRTNDPRGDFRRSMMEMIVETQMVAAKDLQQLLHCLLSLNSVHHHQVIVETFLEIWDALFDDSQ
ncbi:hypothetical protein ACLOJK_020222 [Asimina triloba]